MSKSILLSKMNNVKNNNKTRKNDCKQIAKMLNEIDKMITVKYYKTYICFVKKIL